MPAQLSLNFIARDASCQVLVIGTGFLSRIEHGGNSTLHSRHSERRWLGNDSVHIRTAMKCPRS